MQWMLVRKMYDDKDGGGVVQSRIYAMYEEIKQVKEDIDRQMKAMQTQQSMQ